jgi:hypothetical protein
MTSRGAYPDTNHAATTSKLTAASATNHTKPRLHTSPDPSV